ncbi:MAG: DUF4249 domain-containing protein [Lacibacter sp.]
MIRLLLTITVFVLLAGCEKKVEFQLNESAPLLSVDASIETGQAPFVVLTKSLNYFSSISSAMIGESLIKDATVIVSNGTKSHQLKRYDVVLNGSTPFSYYSADPSDLATFFVGETGKNYQLKITWQGKEYNAATSIPVIRRELDSVWWAKAPATPDTSTKVVVKARVTDAPGFGDYARYFTRVNGGAFLPGFNSVFDDALVNGSTYTVDVDKGIDRNIELNFDEYGFFRRGDTVTIKLSNIDKATYDFWRTVEYNYSSMGNPFSSAIKILGNVSNGALGYFGGYSNQFKTIIIPQ